MDANGGGAYNISNNPAARDIAPAWSTDGMQIVFAASKSRQGEPLELFVMSIDGSNRHQITFSEPTEDDDPAWQP